jgi:hypothetical protein
MTPTARHLFGNWFFEPVFLPFDLQVYRLVHYCSRCGHREEV